MDRQTIRHIRGMRHTIARKRVKVRDTINARSPDQSLIEEYSLKRIHDLLEEVVDEIDQFLRTYGDANEDGL
jgi:hypothetical protein